MAVPAPGNENVDEMIVNVVNDDNMTEDEEVTPTVTPTEPTEEDDPVPTQEPPEPKTPTVLYTRDGFSPREITIKKGESVTFVNNSYRGMWVGSVNHPTHFVYPEKTDNDCLGSAFDQCQIGQPGTSWEFTFNFVGEHGYHNHSRANHLGTVIVE